jgi:hypothetical protein
VLFTAIAATHLQCTGLGPVRVAVWLLGKALGLRGGGRGERQAGGWSRMMGTLKPALGGGLLALMADRGGGLERSAMGTWPMMPFGGGRLMCGAGGQSATLGTLFRVVPVWVHTPICDVPSLTTTKAVPEGHCVALAVHQGLPLQGPPMQGPPIVKCSAPGLQGALLLKQ